MPEDVVARMSLRTLGVSGIKCNVFAFLSPFIY